MQVPRRLDLGYLTDAKMYLEQHKKSIRAELVQADHNKKLSDEEMVTLTRGMKDLNVYEKTYCGLMVDPPTFLRLMESNVMPFIAGIHNIYPPTLDACVLQIFFPLACKYVEDALFREDYAKNLSFAADEKTETWKHRYNAQTAVMMECASKGEEIERVKEYYLKCIQRHNERRICKIFKFLQIKP